MSSAFVQDLQDRQMILRDQRLSIDTELSHIEVCLKALGSVAEDSKTSAPIAPQQQPLLLEQPQPNMAQDELTPQDIKWKKRSPFRTVERYRIVKKWYEDTNVNLGFIAEEIGILATQLGPWVNDLKKAGMLGKRKRRKYRFEGKVVRLTTDTFAQWEKLWPGITDWQKQLNFLEATGVGKRWKHYSWHLNCRRLNDAYNVNSPIVKAVEHASH